VARPDPHPPRGALSRRFYARDVLVVARDVLGRVLMHDGPDGRLSGRIVEVEAYRGADDPASHAYRGPRQRNAVMFGPPGHLYVYFTYGMHECMNLVCGPAGRASAVLIRALEPLEGIEAMQRRRGVREAARLLRGPGCVTRGLGLSRAHDGADLTRGPVWVSREPADLGGHAIARGPRIGIRVATERPWRLYLAGHACVSGPAGGNRRSAVRAPSASRARARSALTPASRGF
jgi:DNA-3-methyladenine glycosylase